MKGWKLKLPDGTVPIDQWVFAMYDGKEDWYYFNELSDGIRGAMKKEAWVGDYYVNTEGKWEDLLWH